MLRIIIDRHVIVGCFWIVATNHRHMLAENDNGMCEGNHDAVKPCYGDASGSCQKPVEKLVPD